MRRGRYSLLGTLCAIAMLATVFAAQARAAEPLAPAWSITSQAVPTNFVPGDTSGTYSYVVSAVNVGGAATDGTAITLADTLPPGIEVNGVELLLRGGGGIIDYSFLACETGTSGASETVRCTVSEELPEAEEPAHLLPTEMLRMRIQVTTPTGFPEEALVNSVSVQGGGAPSASSLGHNQTTSEASPQPAPSGFSYFRALLTQGDGQPERLAASHPYQYVTTFAVNTKATPPGTEAPYVPSGGDLKDIRVDLPPGLVGNPTAASRCTPQQFVTEISPDIEHPINDCPDGSAVGVVLVQQLEGQTSGFFAVPLYNLVPPKGMPAQFGFKVVGAPFYIDTELRTGGDYGITAVLRNSTEVQRVTAATVTFWGTPADERHDPLRGSCMSGSERVPFSHGDCPAGIAPRPFLRLPTSCFDPLDVTMSFNTWLQPGSFASATAPLSAPTDCAALDFRPTISAVPHTTVADSPSGLRVRLHLPQNENPELLATADLRDAVVTLPKGVTVNPAQAGGLSACSPAEIELDGPSPARCPEASKVGSVEVHTPLLDHPVKGGVFVAAQNQNPFGSLLAIYIAVHDPQTGVVVKLAGHVEPDPVTGQLKTTFSDNPQVPFEDFIVEFFDGPRAALRTPTTCGNYTTTTSLTPWSAPESGPAAAPSDSFGVTTAPGGGRCAPTEAAQPHAPAFSSGTLAPVAGAYSPLVTNIKREDGSQILGGINLALPPGLVGKLAGVPYCSEAALAVAAAKSGKAEQAVPSCPVASQVGTVDVGAGAGPSPVHVGGKAYLTGPYKGAPLSLAVITPAVAGPFDLGTVVVRAALRIDPVTARVSAVSDPLPTILQGIPLDVRSVSINVDRSNFTLNPTNCEPMAVGGETISLLGHITPVSSRFQVGGCRGLDFEPRLSLRLKGGNKRSDNPRLIATLKAKEGEANIAAASVKLSQATFLDQSHIRTICTRVQFAAEACPSGSIYGKASAITPLLDYPLTGNVYLRSSSNKLPDLVADLRGPAYQPIRVELVGRTDSVKGALRNTFDLVPDAPVSRFRLELFGGKRGLVVNSRDLCKHPYRANVKFKAQSGRVSHTRPLLRKSCGGRK